MGYVEMGRVRTLQTIPLRCSDGMDCTDVRREWLVAECLELRVDYDEIRREHRGDTCKPS